MAVADVVKISKELMLDEGVFEKKFIQFCQKSKEGVSATDIIKGIPEMTSEKLVFIVNKLSKTGKLEFLKRGNQLLYKIKENSINNFFSGDVNERIVYDNLDQAGSKGLYPLDLKSKTGMSLTAVNKVLKNLESRNIVKSHLSIQGRDSAGKKKVYVLSHITPDISITGGNLYDNNELEMEYVSVLIQQTHKFLLLKYEPEIGCSNYLENNLVGWVSPEEVLVHINSLGICKTKLTLEEVEKVLENLVYEGKADQSNKHVPISDYSKTTTNRAYRAVRHKNLGIVPGFCAIPCTYCKLIKNCTTDGVISPKTCEYMNNWLKDMKS